jgi:uncharacterized protein
VKEVKRKLLVTLGILLLAICFLYFQNNAIVTTKLSIRSDEIPKDFNGYRMVQLSDLHSKSFGKDQRNLVQKVRQVKPHLIVFTGDLVDSKKYDEETSLKLMEQLVQIAPVYFVTGNHEWWSGKFDSLEHQLIDMGVKVLRNTVAEITHENGDGGIIQLVGIDDPANASEAYMERSMTEEALKSSVPSLKESEDFTVLLAHRPELLSLYSQYEMDLVFSGHAHGGQVRLPFVGGVIAPNQGLFPNYTSGRYTQDETTMIVNRGLGNSIIPFRIFNRPEIILVTLETE